MALPPSESIAVSLDALRSNPLRTFLSTLGVVIGVAALVAILALGDGLERYGREQIQQTTDLQVISITPSTTESIDGVRVLRPDPAVIQPSDVEALRARLGDNASAALMLLGSERVRFPGDTAPGAVQVMAMLPAGQGVLPWPLATGRFLRDADVQQNEAVAVASAGLARALASEGESAVGHQLEAGGRRWRIVGQLGGDEGARMLYVPLTAWARQRWGQAGRRLPAAIVRARTLEAVPQARVAVDTWAKARFRPEAVVVSSNRQRASQARQAMLVFKLAMAAIAGISLLVGGIGIMNILLASISERTREIGIRKAAGARPRDILYQFLAESVAIAGLGSVIGVLLGMGGAFVVAAGIRRFTGAPLDAAFTWPSVALAAFAALAVGLAFGTYPARRAARLAPIEALRYE
ncbi:MAG: ABC transporter permease [Gemmatimonadota bacterium]